MLWCCSCFVSARAFDRRHSSVWGPGLTTACRSQLSVFVLVLRPPPPYTSMCIGIRIVAHTSTQDKFMFVCLLIFAPASSEGMGLRFRPSRSLIDCFVDLCVCAREC
mmetsp:Transcript_72460/g.207873  ORF Transcript_72460/g.207873 Transcript_72460/m.207873 type:complete len:107 (+) Transcript_72460:866-1186(+)